MSWTELSQPAIYAPSLLSLRSRSFFHTYQTVHATHPMNSAMKPSMAMGGAGGAVDAADNSTNSSVTGINDVVYTAGWINDTWKLNSRLTLNLGVRLENYKDQWPDQSLVPNGQPALAGWTDPRWVSFIAPKDVKATTVANTTTLAPKVGFAYDLFGDNRTVIKGFIGQSR